MWKGQELSWSHKPHRLLVCVHSSVLRVSAVSVPHTARQHGPVVLFSSYRYGRGWRNRSLSVCLLDRWEVPPPPVSFGNLLTQEGKTVGVLSAEDNHVASIPPEEIWECHPNCEHAAPVHSGIYTLLGNLAVIPAVWDAQNSVRSRLDPNESPEVKCKVAFSVVSILFCTKEDSAPVFCYGSGLVCLIAHFLSVPDVNDKYWLLEYLLSSSCVLALKVLEKAVVWDNLRFVFSVKYFCSWSYSWLPCSKAISVLPVAWLASWNCKDRIYYALTIKF